MEREKLRFAAAGDPSLLVFDVPAELAFDGKVKQSFAIPIKARHGGLLLAIPLQCLDSDRLIDEMSGEGDGILGPSKSFVSPLLIEDESGVIGPADVNCRLIVVDFSNDVLPLLHEYDPNVDNSDEILPFDADLPQALPDVSELPDQVVEWARSQEANGRAHFYSAREEEEEADRASKGKGSSQKNHYSCTSGAGEYSGCEGRSFGGIAGECSYASCGPHFQSSRSRRWKAAGGPTVSSFVCRTSWPRTTSWSQFGGKGCEFGGASTKGESKAFSKGRDRGACQSPTPQFSPGSHVGCIDPAEFRPIVSGGSFDFGGCHDGLGRVNKLISKFYYERRAAKRKITRRSCSGDFHLLRSGLGPDSQKDSSSPGSPKDSVGPQGFRHIYFGLPHEVWGLQGSERDRSYPLAGCSCRGCDAGGGYQSGNGAFGTSVVQSRTGCSRPRRLVCGIFGFPSRRTTNPVVPGPHDESSWTRKAFCSVDAKSMGGHDTWLPEGAGDSQFEEGGDISYSGQSCSHGSCFSKEKDSLSQETESGSKCSMTHMVHGGVVRGGGDPGEFVARHATKNNTFVGNPPMNSNGPWEEEMSFPKWSALLPSQILRSRSSFAAFLRTSFSLHRSSTSTPTTLFPIPVPDGGYFDRMSPGAGRKKGALLIGRLLHIITMAFNFWHFGGDFVPAELLGRAPSSVHRRFYARVRAFIKSESQSSTFSVAKAGRRFPQLVARLCDLSLSLTKLHSGREAI